MKRTQIYLPDTLIRKLEALKIKNKHLQNILNEIEDILLKPPRNRGLIFFTQKLTFTP